MDVVWHTEHSDDVVMCVQPPPLFLVIGVQVLPALLWQLEQLLAPVWFIVTVVQLPPTVWQLPQVLPVIGAKLCAVVPLIGRPALGTAAPAISWHPAWVQLLAVVTPLAAWLKVVGQAVVVWQAEHCDVVLMWLTLAGVNPLPL